MLTAQNLADWLKAQGITDTPLFTEGYIPEGVPGAAFLVTTTGGPGEEAERTRDVQSAQVLSRSGQRGTDGETLASLVDDLILGAVPPLTMSGVRVISTQRAGGPPTFLQRDTAGRSVYACNYLLRVARTVF